MPQAGKYCRLPVVFQGAAAGPQHKLLKNNPLVFHGMIFLRAFLFNEESFKVLGFLPEIEQFVITKIFDLVFQGELVGIGKKLAHEAGLLEGARSDALAV